MKVNFKINPGIPLEEIKDSMQLDSGQVIAKLEVGNYRLKLEVVGDVRVRWNSDPKKTWEDDGSELYKHASQMPDELLRIFSQNRPASDFPNLNVINNNWFEVIVYYKGHIVYSDLDDLEELDPCDIFTSLWDMYLEFKKDEDNLEKKFQETIKNEPAQDGLIEDVPAYDLINKLKEPPMSEEDVHDILAATLYDCWGYPVGRLNDMNYKYDIGKGRYGGLIGA